MTNIKKLTFAAVFTALAVVMKVFLTFLFFRTTKFGFTFVPMMVGSAMLGPLWGGVIGALSDILGWAIKPDGSYFYGFTLSAVLKGFFYGAFLYRRPKNLINILLAVTLSIIVVDLCINSIWINIYYGTPLQAVFVSKLTTLPVFAALQYVIMLILFKILNREISRFSE
ncbi:MAG: Folate transporter FolT [Firmicutes bacterium ADurb.Bin193]|nr:MAG: Folate transporter FolT [Firmicutes bacterium ADurb.Bin193]